MNRHCKKCIHHITLDKKALITKLAINQHKARVIYENLSNINQSTDPDKRQEQHVQYALAKAELLEATDALENAMRPTK